MPCQVPSCKPAVGGREMLSCVWVSALLMWGRHVVGPFVVVAVGARHPRARGGAERKSIEVAPKRRATHSPEPATKPKCAQCRG